MSINSVKSYLASKAPSISLTGTIWVAVHGYTQRPKREKVGDNVILAVGDVRRREDRLSMPRGSAEKENVYQVSILLYAAHSDEIGGGNHFDALIENACDVYRRATPGNPTLVDAITGQTSYLTYIGENIEVRTFPPEMTAPQGRTEFRAVLTLQVKEILSPA